MKKIVIMLMALLTTAQGFSQSEAGRWTITPKAGVNWSNRTEGDIYYGTGLDEKVKHSSRRGFAIGAEAEYFVHQNAGISAGLIYSQQGCDYDDAPQVWKDTKLKLDYLNIPVMVHCYPVEHFGLQVGMQPGFLVRKKLSGEEYYSEENRSGYRSFETNVTFMRNFDLSIPVGVSFDLDYLRLEFRYCFGIYDTTKIDQKEHNNTAQLTIGYRFRL